MPKSFLDAWKDGEIGGFAAAMDLVHEGALLENALRDEVQKIVQNHRMNVRAKVTALTHLIQGGQ